MQKNIWFKKDLTLQDIIDHTAPHTLTQHLGMEWKAQGNDFVEMKMPVDKRTHQPYGILHGGASCALAETVGSVASHLVIDTQKYYCVGLDINANHVRPVHNGFVTAKATPLHLGKRTHVWDIKIKDEADKLICISRLTVAILEKKIVGV